MAEIYLAKNRFNSSRRYFVNAIKLFDFGLAKELKDNLKLADGNYKLTGDTGSPRYMAPGKSWTLLRALSIDLFHYLH